jgi:hypothetical protein
VVLQEEDFVGVDVEATQTVDIIDFVKIVDFDPSLVGPWPVGREAIREPPTN